MIRIWNHLLLKELITKPSRKWNVFEVTREKFLQSNYNCCDSVGVNIRFAKANEEAETYC